MKKSVDSIHSIARRPGMVAALVALALASGGACSDDDQGGSSAAGAGGEDSSVQGNLPAGSAGAGGGAGSSSVSGGAGGAGSGGASSGSSGAGGSASASAGSTGMQTAGAGGSASSPDAGTGNVQHCDYSGVCLEFRDHTPPAACQESNSLNCQNLLGGTYADGPCSPDFVLQGEEQTFCGPTATFVSPDRP